MKTTKLGQRNQLYGTSNYKGGRVKYVQFKFLTYNLKDEPQNQGQKIPWFRNSIVCKHELEMIVIPWQYSDFQPSWIDGSKWCSVGWWWLLRWGREEGRKSFVLDGKWQDVQINVKPDEGKGRCAHQTDDDCRKPSCCCNLHFFLYFLLCLINV